MSNLPRLDSAAVSKRRTLFWLASRRPIASPRKALILQPYDLSSVMLATPLLAALSEAFPKAHFDWVVESGAAAAIAGNPRLRRPIVMDPEPAKSASQGTAELVRRLKDSAYDMCFLPDRAGALASIARKAGIPQRIALASGGLAQGNTVLVTPPGSVRHRALRNLSLAVALGVAADILHAVEAEFTPSDADRTAVTRWLVEELDWLGDTPLVMIQPGGTAGVQGQADRNWPAARFARLANHLGRAHGARVILVGDSDDQLIAADVAGMVAVPVANQVGQMGLGQVAALGEVARLYVGNDAGPTHVVAAAGCPTLAIFGPTDPAQTAPYSRRVPIETLWHQPADGPFSWDDGVSVEEAVAAVDRLLGA